MMGATGFEPGTRSHLKVDKPTPHRRVQAWSAAADASRPRRAAAAWAIARSRCSVATHVEHAGVVRLEEAHQHVIGPGLLRDVVKRGEVRVIIVAPDDGF